MCPYLRVVELILGVDINRLNAVHQITTALVKPKPRIVVLSVTEDESSQYVAIMNCIFSAQKAVSLVNLFSKLGSECRDR